MNATSAKSSVVPALLLTGLLLLLAFRLTCTESLRETIMQKAARLDYQEHPSPDTYVAPFIGPVWTAGYVTLALLLAGGAAIASARRGAFSGVRLGQFLLIAAILAVLVASTLHAADHFSALVGMVDLATGLLCAWAAALLCDDALLGQRGRNAAVAAIVAILGIGVAKGLMQHFIEYPDLADYVRQHTDEALRRAGISNDPAQRELFLSRVNSAEVSGFGALSNVFATQVIALLGLAAAIIVAAIPRLKNAQVSVEGPGHARADDRPADKHLDYASRRDRKPRVMKARQPGEIPVEFIGFGGLCIVAAATVCVVPMTESKGGSACAALAVVAVALGAYFRRWFVAHRRGVLIAGAACVALGTAAVVGFGMTHHRLPTKSLLFRWHYWTASVPMVERSPALGVGLNNFGDYYLQYKSPASPEDVKDPHNFFVRLAAEMGIPATLLVTALMIWLVMRGFRAAASKRDGQTLDSGAQASAEESGKSATLTVAGVVAILWIPLHLISEGSDAFTTSMTMIYAVIGWAIFAAALVLLDAISAVPDRPAKTPLPPRFIGVACTIAALCMLLYDQVNMALVTGPVAMLFWLMLSLGDASAGRTSNVQRRARAAGWLAGIVCLAGCAVSAVLFFVPLARDSFALDPAPWEFAYVRYMSPVPRDDLALKALDQAIALSPNSGELIMQRITLKRNRLHVPVADDIRRVLLLDRANARVRLDLALPDTDLPPAERIAALQDALRFDEALASFGKSFSFREPKQLSDEQVETIRNAIARLTQATKP